MFPLQGGTPAARLAIEDVFLCNTRTGTGAAYSVTGGPNLATYGGMVHIKDRSNARNHNVYDTARGSNYMLRTNSIATDVSDSGSTVYCGFNSDGFSLKTYVEGNGSGETYVDWVWRNSYNFFQILEVTKASGSNKVIDLSPYMAAVGMVKVKLTDQTGIATGSWYVWHRSLTAGKLLIGETTAGETTLGQITVSGTTLTLVDGVIADGDYHIEAYAHDTSTDGLIQCGSVVTDGSSNATITLNWEAQYFEYKTRDSSDNWVVIDSMRGFPVGSNWNGLLTNSPSAEVNASSSYIKPTATGVVEAGLWPASQTIIYRAVRRGPMRFPTSGAQVYQGVLHTGNGATRTITGAGFPPDLALNSDRAGGSHFVYDRLRGSNAGLKTESTVAEADFGSQVLTMDGVTYNPSSNNWNFSGDNYINHFFRRWPGVLDFFADTGTGANKTEAHNLTVAPKFWFRKSRSGATQWVFGSTLLAATEKIVSPSPAGKVTDATAWNSTYPTATAFSVGTASATNTSAATYITYLVGELAGVSKVFGYTGNGTSQTIPCGFAAGARFVLIVRTDTTGSFWIFDTVRGIVAGSDPALALDTTAAEVTTADALDPDASGFIVNQETTLNLNVNTATYIGFAIA